MGHFCFIPQLFHKDRIPAQLPQEMENVVARLRKTRSKDDCLREAYDILTTKYRGYRVTTYIDAYDAFDSNVEHLWKRNGFLHCHHFNYLLRILLLQSGKFHESDIRLKRSWVWFFSVHQYVRVKVQEKKWISVDMWGKSYGIPFGDYAHGFH